MASLSGPLQRLIDEFKQLPGIGTRSAERIVFHLLKADAGEVFQLAEALRSLKEKVRPCARCFNLAEGELCHICLDERRDRALIIVVEQPKDLLALEATGLISGVYHVLMGHIAPLDGIEPQHLTLSALVQRVRGGGVRELILATNPTVEGDATALYITTALADLKDVRISRLARGLAPGAHIEYANRSMLEEAFRGRRELD